MSRGAPLRIVCYAVNGTGVGHLARLLAIARWLRRYGAAMAEKLEIWFLTSSEAEGLAFAEGFAAFKIPSKTIVAEAGIDRTTHVALAKQWIWHTLGLLRPDLLIVDTFPRGSFGELLSALDLCRRTAFVYRPVRPEVAARPDFQAMLSLYDLLLVPEESANASVLVPPKARDRLFHVGPILGRERWELLPREVARARLGIPEGSRCVFVSAGGGGDKRAEAQVANTVRALSADPTLSVVAGTGALYRGEPVPHTTTLPGRAAEWSLAFDAAVSAAGYNTYNELMFAGVPTAFLPQHKLADDQESRAQRAVDAGAGALLAHDADGESVRQAVRELLGRPDARSAARALVPENCARVAAAELLRLLFSRANLDRAEATLDETRLVRLRDSRVTEHDAVSLGHRLARGAEDDLGAAIDRAAAMLTGRDAHETRELRGLVDAVVRGMSADVAARADVCDVALTELGALRHGDGAAARAALADARWGGEGSADGAALAREIRHAPQTESSSSFLSTK